MAKVHIEPAVTNKRSWTGVAILRVDPGGRAFLKEDLFLPRNLAGRGIEAERLQRLTPTFFLSANTRSQINAAVVNDRRRPSTPRNRFFPGDVLGRAPLNGQ